APSCLMIAETTVILINPPHHCRGVHSFPTRRSSDLTMRSIYNLCSSGVGMQVPEFAVTDRTDFEGYESLYVKSVRSVTANSGTRSEEHTSELQSRENLVCRRLLEKKKGKREDREICG